MLKPSIWFVLLCLTLLAPFFVFDHRELSRDARVFRPPLQSLSHQLDGLAELLRVHRTRHGRYPTREEGLSTLDGYIARFPSGLDPKSLGKLVPAPYPMYSSLRYRLEEFHVDEGRYPESMVEFRSLFYRSPEPMSTVPEGPQLAEVAIAPSGAAFVLHEGEVLTDWGGPFIYENRTSAAPETFRDSPAGEAERTPFSRKVDDGIFVLSLEAWSFAASQREHQRIIRTKTGILIALGAFFLVMFLASLRAARKRGGRRFWTVLLGAGVGLSLLVGSFASMATRHTCYIMSYFRWWLTPERIPVCEALLEKYRTSGAIRPETYEKLRRAFDEEASRLSGDEK